MLNVTINKKTQTILAKKLKNLELNLKHASVLPTGGFGVCDKVKFEVYTNNKVHINTIDVKYSEELKQKKTVSVSSCIYKIR